MQVKIIVTALGRILKWSINTGGLLIQVVFRSGLTVVILSQYGFCFVFILRTMCQIRNMSVSSRNKYILLL